MSDDTSWDEVVALIARLGDEFRISWAMDTPPDEAMIAAAENQLDLRFPDDYRAFLRRFGAIYVDVAPAIWRRPVAYEVRPVWQTGYGRIVAGVAARLHDDLSVVAQTEALRERGVEDFVPVLREVIGNGDWIGYGAEGQLVRWRHDEDGLEPCGEGLAARVRAGLEQLAADREQLRTEPIGPAPAPIVTRRSYTVSFVLQHDRDARLAAVEAAVAALRVAHQVTLALELIGYDDAGNRRVPTGELTLVDLVDDDDALAHLHVDGLEAQLTLGRPLQGPGVELNVGVLGDPRELPIGAAIHAAFERALDERGVITSRVRNWEGWK